MSHPWIVDQHVSESQLIAVLLQYGVAIVRNAVNIDARRALQQELDREFAEASYCEGLFYGRLTKRFGRLLSKSLQSQKLVMNDLAVGPAKSILGPDCQEIQLNLTQAIEIWPGSFAQVPHRDQDIWLGSNHVGELMINAMWAVDDFTVDNGATLIWPGSHRQPEMKIPEGPGVPTEMPSGSLCLFLGSTMHCGGANWSAAPRRGLVISYCLGWLKPCENPWLSYPPEVAKRFDPALRRMIGYRQDAPSLNNVDGRCPSHLLEDSIVSQGFSDTLTADQLGLIEQFNEMQSVARARAA